MEVNNISKDGKLAAIIAHFFYFGSYNCIFYKSRRKRFFRQILYKTKRRFNLCLLLLGSLVGAIPNPYAAYGFYAFIFILWIYSFSGAVSNEYKLIPFIGGFIQKIFTKKN